MKDLNPSTGTFDPPALELEYPELGEVIRSRRLRGHIRRVLNDRNALCDCGSGRKTKKCCMNLPVADGFSWTMKITAIDGVPCNLVLKNS